VPVLLEFLESPDAAVANGARQCLRLLTHRTVSDPRDDQNESPHSQYAKWSQWWAIEGATARIYGATECGDFVPLLHWHREPNDPNFHGSAHARLHMFRSSRSG
jgi:hypothetical protein